MPLVGSLFFSKSTGRLVLATNVFAQATLQVAIKKKLQGPKTAGSQATLFAYSDSPAEPLQAEAPLAGPKPET
ncbi:MAG TPA: hypothetical protein VLH77_05820 [Gammaproteobacteria bacterium]|nr:hypothetical protein [Gammaproteobacteria bacterium]